MGFNTVALMLNDQCHRIEEDDRLGSVLRNAMASGTGSDHEISGLTVLPSQHADWNQIILAGGNRITALGGFRGSDHTKENLLRELAADLGYSLTKRRRRRDPA